MNMEFMMRLGFSKNETKVYFALLKLGTAPISEVTGKSGVHRSNVYDSIGKLMEKGLVSTVTNSGKKVYTASNPKALRNIIREQEKMLEDEMPDLNKQYDFSRKRQDVQLFRGSSGIKTILRDINASKTYDAFGISSNLKRIVPYYFDQWIRERIRRGRFARMIKTEGDELATRKAFGEKIYRKLFEVRELPKEFYTPAATFIYGGKVAVILESVEDPVGIVIDNKGISDGYRKQFLALWVMAKSESR